MPGERLYMPVTPAIPSGPYSNSWLSEGTVPAHDCQHDLPPVAHVLTVTPPYASLAMTR